MMELAAVVVALILASTRAESDPAPIKAKVIIMTNSQIGVSQRVGVIDFVQYSINDTVQITGEVLLGGRGEPIVRLGMHVHAYGDMSQGCESTGPHYNPTGQHHGSRTEAERHIGDLGNIVVTSQRATIDLTDDQIQLTGPHSIIGRALVIHQGEDDLGKGGDEESLRTGNAGSRWACGIIGLVSDHAEFPAKSIASSVKAVSVILSIGVMMLARLL